MRRKTQINIQSILSITSEQKMKNKVTATLFFLGLLCISTAQNLQGNYERQHTNQQNMQPMIGQQQFNPYPYEVYTPFENDLQESKHEKHNQENKGNEQNNQDFEAINTFLLYGSILGVGIISIVLVNECCCSKNQRNSQRRNRISRAQPRRPIPEGRIYYSEPRGVLNTQNQVQSPIVQRQQPQKEVYPVSALDQEIEFHKKQIKKLQKDKEQISKQQIQRRKQEQQALLQKQKILKEKLINQPKAMMREPTNQPRNLQMQNNYYGNQNNQHPIIMNQPQFYQPKAVEKRQTKEAYAGYIQIGQKAPFGKQIQPIPKKDNDSSFASQYPEI